MKKEKNIFLEVVGETPQTRILDFLITMSHYDYSKTEIAKNSGVSYTNLEIILPQLIKLGLVKKTRKIGKADLFKLNAENPTAKVLILYHWNIIKSRTCEKFKLEPVKIPNIEYAYQEQPMMQR